MDFKINIITENIEISSLIKKTFAKENYVFYCTECKDSNCSEEINKLDIVPDCIIIDRDINIECITRVIKQHNNLNIILLPTLDESETKNNKKFENVIEISEPFRLAELGDELNKIYLKKKSETIIKN